MDGKRRRAAEPRSGGRGREGEEHAACSVRLPRETPRRSLLPPVIIILPST